MLILFILLVLILGPIAHAQQRCHAPLTVRMTGLNSFVGEIARRYPTSDWEDDERRFNQFDSWDIPVPETPLDRITDNTVWLPARPWVIAFTFTVPANTRSGFIASVSYNGRQIPRSTTGSIDSEWKFTTNDALASAGSGWNNLPTFNDAAWSSAGPNFVGSGFPIRNSEGYEFINYVSSLDNSTRLVSESWYCLNATTSLGGFVAARISGNGQVECIRDGSTSNCLLFSSRSQCLSSALSTPSNQPSLVCTPTNYATSGHWCNLGSQQLPRAGRTAQWISLPSVNATQKIYFRLVVNLTSEQPPCYNASQPRYDMYRTSTYLTVIRSMTFGQPSATKKLLTIRINVDDDFDLYINNRYYKGSGYYSRVMQYNFWMDPSDILIALKVWTWDGNKGVAASITYDGAVISTTDGSGEFLWTALNAVPTSGWNHDYFFDETGWITLNGSYRCDPNIWIYGTAKQNLYVIPTDTCLVPGLWSSSCAGGPNQAETMYMRLKLPLASRWQDLVRHSCNPPALALTPAATTTRVVNPTTTASAVITTTEISVPSTISVPTITVPMTVVVTAATTVTVNATAAQVTEVVTVKESSAITERITVVEIVSADPQPEPVAEATPTGSTGSTAAAGPSANSVSSFVSKNVDIVLGGAGGLIFILLVAVVGLLIQRRRKMKPPVGYPYNTATGSQSPMMTAQATSTTNPMSMMQTNTGMSGYTTTTNGTLYHGNTTYAGSNNGTIVDNVAAYVTGPQTATYSAYPQYPTSRY